MDKKLQRFLSAMLILTCLWMPIPAFADSDSSKSYATKEAVSSVKGLFYQMPTDADTVESLREHLDQMLLEASQTGFNTIFYSPFSKEEQVEKFTLPAFSIGQRGNLVQEGLYYLSQRCEELGLSIVLVYDPFVLSSQSPAYAFVKNVAQKNRTIAYNNGGLLYLEPTLDQNRQFSQLWLQELLAAGNSIDEILLSSMTFISFQEGQDNDQIVQAKRMADFLEKSGGGHLKVSVSYEKQTVPTNKIHNGSIGVLPDTIQENRLADSVYPVFSILSYQMDSYQKSLKNWLALASDLQVVPLLRLDEKSSSDFSLNQCLYANGTMGISSVGVSDYNTLFRVKEKAMLFSAALNQTADFIPNGYSLNIPQTLSISRPTADLTISTSAYYMMGTSNPALPLYLNGELVERQTTNGCFGVYLSDIPVGSKTYVFSQGGQSKSVVITRTDPTQTTISKISKIVQSSMYPYYNEGVKVGEKMELRCTAPAGSSVSATFQGKTVSLSAKATAEKGVPTIFTGTMIMPDFGKDNETVKVSPITYTLSYNGATTQYTSTSEMYAVGKSATLAVMANDYINNVYGDVSVEDDFYMTLFNGACDYVEEVTQTHYKLRSGGYLPKSTADILAGTPVIENKVTRTNFSIQDAGESLSFTGCAKPPYKGEMTDANLTVTLWNTTGISESIALKDSQLFDSVTVTKNEDQSVTLQFAYKPGVKLWGYSIEYKDNDLIIFAKKAPTLSQNIGKPLTGIVVVIDAGHGGEDPGALGIAGSNGPTEKDLNFISAYAAKQTLESLGATVHMVSEDNARLSFEERMDPARQMRADFFLSFHHNSTNESADSAKYAGVEVYYHEEQSKAFAENALQNIAAATGRTARGFYQDYYRVTRMTYAPSLLLELGFVVNPVEYEKLCQPIHIYETSLAVSQAIICTITTFQ